jgi:hypothetical protein
MGGGSGGSGSGGRSGGGGSTNGDAKLDYKASELNDILSSEYSSKGVRVSRTAFQGGVELRGKAGIDGRMVINTLPYGSMPPGITASGKSFPYTTNGLIKALAHFEKENRI